MTYGFENRNGGRPAPRERLVGSRHSDGNALSEYSYDKRQKHKKGLYEEHNAMRLQSGRVPNDNAGWRGEDKLYSVIKLSLPHLYTFTTPKKEARTCVVAS